MATKIQARRDTAANWTSVNPVLAAGEPGFESDTGKFKFGDGTTAWNSLAYAGGGGAIADQSITPRMLADTARIGSQAPTGTIAQTGARRVATGSVSMTGQVLTCALLEQPLPAGRALTKITFSTKGSAAVTLAHAWACLFDLAGNVLATTVDMPAAIAAGTWPANTPVDFLIATTLGGGTAGAVTPPGSNATPAYAALLVQAGTMPTLKGFTGDIDLAKLAPVLCGTTGSGLTTPASLGSTVTPPSAANAGSGTAWAMVS